ncbi:MAG: hypothetical protein Q8J65_00735 [Nitrosomonadales bacterium]|nr:hypothetical protein [Nitrosomonadales bacterium]
MKYPAFFDEVPSIRLVDPLAEFLGATDDGIMEYRYIDVVKLTGHSCPTVASAYWMTLMALRVLYLEKMPERGNIRVEFNQEHDEGVTGVIANVVGFLTGAADGTGFKGIANKFDRREKLYFASGISADIRFTRLDTGGIIETTANLSHVPTSKRIMELMSKCRNAMATSEETLEFRQLWQDRVRSLLLTHSNDPKVFSFVAYAQ